MKHTALFIHLLGLSVWLGALIAIITVLFVLRSPKIGADAKQSLGKLQTVLTVIGNLGALALLISGFVMFTMHAHQALWIDVMAALGGGLSIFSIIAITLQSYILSGRLKTQAFDKLMDIQIGFLTISSWMVTVGVVIVIAIASYK